MPTTRFLRPALLVSLITVSSLTGCASRTPPRSAPAAPPPPSPAATTTASPPTPARSGEAAPGAPHLGPGAASAPAALSPSASLARELELLFAAPTLSTAVVSALVQSLDTGEVLYRLNPHTLVVPASNQKIVTMAVGAARLGWDYRFETRFETLAPLVGETLQGDLIVVGGGDPSINARDGDRLAVFRDWASKLKAAGITRVTGRLVGDDDAFEDERFGAGWAWDNFAYAYAAPVGALQFNENFVEIVVRPGARPGDAAAVELRPAGSGLVLSDVRVTTVPAGTRTRVSFNRFPGRREVQVEGSVEATAREHVERAAVDNPTAYFVSVLRDTLREQGVAVDGDAVDIDEAPDAAALKTVRGTRRVVLQHRSPPLAEIGRTLMKASQNLYAETVFRAVSLGDGIASVDASREVVTDTLRGWGVAPGEFSVADGSGLSRLNFVSASMIVRVLRAMARDPETFLAFEASLPIAGKDGTIGSRLRATRAEGNAIAKTGTLSRVRSLSGYVRTLDGERVVFSFIANNFMVPSSTVDAVVDQAVERLANFSR